MHRETGTLEDIWKRYLPAFLLSILLVMVSMAVAGILPFGEKSLLIVDMSSEYVDYFLALRNAFFSGEGLDFWFEMSMGLTPIGLFAYYLASPFLFLVILLPSEMILEAIYLMTILKIGSAALTFSIFAHRGMNLRGIWPVLFGISWALIGYNIAYSSNIMWLDGVILTPLVIWGVMRIVREGRPWLFFASILLCFYTSYYISYMIGLFSALFFLFESVCQKISWRIFWRRCLMFAGVTLLAALIMAWLLLPTYENLATGQESFLQPLPTAEGKFTLAEFFGKFTVGAYDTIGNGGVPHIYVGCCALLLATLYFFCPSIAPLEKIGAGVLLLLLFLSFYLNQLWLVWHAFDYPTWYEYRNSFLFAFLLLWMACRTVRHRANLPRPALPIACALWSILFLAVLSAGELSWLDWGGVLVTILLVVVYGLFFDRMLWGNKRIAAPLGVLLTAVLSMELCCNASVLFGSLDEEFGYDSRTSYLDFVERYRPAAQLVKRPADDFYRVENIDKRSANDAMTLGYASISHYSTTTYQRLNELLETLGHDLGTLNETRYSQNTIVSNALLGIRYLLCEEYPEDAAAYREVGQYGDVTVLENPYALPLVFAADREALSTTWETTSSAFSLQNEIYSGLLGRETQILEPIDWETEWEWGARLEKEEGRYRLAADSLDSGWVSLSVRNPEEKPAYFRMPVADGGTGSASLYYDGYYKQHYFTYRHNGVLPLRQTTEFSLSLWLHEPEIPLEGIEMAAVDLSELAAATEILRAHAIDYEVVDNAHIVGQISVAEDQVVVTTIPYSAGWRATVDGQEVPVDSWLEVFCALDLPAGEHRVELTYQPPGAALGGILSAIGVGILLILWAVLLWRGHRRERGIWR